MSAEVTAWAWKQELAPATKLVLLKLADCANNDAVCWPGQVSLWEQCGISERQFRRCIAELKEKQLVKVTRRGQGNTNLYELLRSDNLALLDRTPHGVSEEPSTRDKTLVFGSGESLVVDGLVSMAKNGKEPKSERAAAKKKPHQIVWDALELLYGRSPATKDERGQWNKAIIQFVPALHDEGVDVWDVEAVRAALEPLKWEAWERWGYHSPVALAKWWSDLRQAHGMRQMAEARRGNGTAQTRR